MLEIRDLRISADGREIIKGVSLKIKTGEIHALMGPNGSGKSTLALALAGHPRYKIISGQVKLDGKNLTNLPTNKRAKLGLFFAMQHPIAVPGVSVANFLRTAYKNLKRDAPQPASFIKGLKENLAYLKLDPSLAARGVNDGFSGGEKKKSEVLQLSVLKPKYAILDEVDSGLDIDSLKKVAEQIRKVSGPEVGILLITHYQRILKYIKPDQVHILVGGKIVAGGDYKLAELVEEKGYRVIANNKIHPEVEQSSLQGSPAPKPVSGTGQMSNQ